MSELKHTPGPWGIWDSRTQNRVGMKGELFITKLLSLKQSKGQSEAKYKQIAEIPTDNKEITVEDMANARLIAAAPELLEMLIEAEDHLEYCGYGDSWEREGARACKLPQRITKAIARAEGSDNE